MVSQLLHPSPLLLPRALLPASSLEPLEEEERVLCSFERVRVAAGGVDGEDGAASAAVETSSGADAVGTLHVTSRRIVWLPSGDQSTVSGFQAGFASIVMHALQGGGGGGASESEGRGDDKSSSTPAVPAAAAVYLQLDDDGGEGDDAAFRGTGEFDDAEEGEEEGEDLPPSTCPPNDLRLVPLASSSAAAASPSSIAKEIFSAMCEAAALNPTAGEAEPLWEGGEDDDGGEWFYDEKEVADGLSASAPAPAPLSSAGAARLARYDALLQMPRAEDLEELLDDEEQEEEEFDEDEDDVGDADEQGGDDDDDDDDGRFDDPEPEATAAATTTAATTPKP